MQQQKVEHTHDITEAFRVADVADFTLSRVWCIFGATFWT